MDSHEKTSAPTVDAEAENVTAPRPSRVREKDDMYYFSDIVLEVEDRLFRIPSFYLMQESEAFNSMFLLPQSQTPGESREGGSDAHPIVLEGVTKDEFRQLLRVLIQPAGGEPTLTIAEWSSVLKLATMWDFARIRQKAIDKISAQSQDPIERILLVDKFEVPNWELAALNELCRRTEELTVEEGEKLGMKRVLKMMQAREEYYSNNGSVGTPCSCNRSTLVLQLYCGYCGVVAVPAVIARSSFDFTPKLKSLLDL